MGSFPPEGPGKTHLQSHKSTTSANRCRPLYHQVESPPIGAIFAGSPLSKGSGNNHHLPVNKTSSHMTSLPSRTATFLDLALASLTPFQGQGARINPSTSRHSDQE